MHKIALFLSTLLTLVPQMALAGATAEAPEVKVRLLSGVTAVGQASTLPLGLEVQLAPHWKTYWRTPGTAGLPVSIDWSGSENLASASLNWPAPHRFVYAGLNTFGYTDRVVLPISVHPALPGQPVRLTARVDLMACEALCIPFNFDLSLEVPAGAATATPDAAELAHWQQRVPGATHPQLGISDVTPTATGYAVTVTADPPLQQPDLFVESPSGLMYGPPNPSAATSPVTLEVTRLDDAPNSPPDSQITVTLVDGDRAVEKTVQLGAVPAPAPAQPEGLSMASALLAAFIGGLILNLMPCVLPVLSLKLLSIVSHGGSPAHHVRLSFLASAAGIITSFLGLAAIAIGLKQAGMAVGWGVQFQHPVFLMTMVVLLILFAASLWNLIHIPLPRFMADAINDSLPAPGQHDRTLAGNFVTGAFATILATPCSAPFVGTALGFALAGSALDIAVTALVMGLGLATPYLLVAAFPALANKLPRPGRWMNWLKAVLGLALLFTALWMASTAHQQLEGDMATYAVGTPLLLLALLWLRASFTQPVVLLKGLAGMVVVFALVQAYDRLQPAQPQPLNWQTFAQNDIAPLVASGKVVFVDVTADWCLTCKANKRFVLNAEPTRTRLTDPQIVLMMADWTRPSEEIAAYLKSFGRYGIPFNVVYGPGAPQGLALPELLNTDAVDKALQQAKQPPAPGSCSTC